MIRKFILGTASILALGLAGPALDFAADADDVANAAPGSSQHWLDAASLSKDDIRWAQVELHTIGLYNGSLDGTGAGSMTNSSGTSDFGSRTRQN